jgi:hypothetical protein
VRDRPRILEREAPALTVREPGDHRHARLATEALHRGAVSLTELRE